MRHRNPAPALQSRQSTCLKQSAATENRRKYRRLS
jgi:hypothetical protein